MRRVLQGSLKLIVNPNMNVQQSYYRIDNDSLDKYINEALYKPTKSEFEYPDGEKQEIFTSSGPDVKITIETEELISCVKCGCSTYSIRYMGPGDLNCGYPDHSSAEHLHYICDRCYYVWEMPTLDNNEYIKKNINIT